MKRIVVVVVLFCSGVKGNKVKGKGGRRLRG